ADGRQTTSEEKRKSGRQLQMTNAENSTLGYIRHAVNLPAMRQHDLLNHGKPQAGTGFLSCEIRLEDFLAQIRRDTRTVIPDLEGGFPVSFLSHNFDGAAGVNRLGRV